MAGKDFDVDNFMDEIEEEWDRKQAAEAATAAEDLNVAAEVVEDVGADATADVVSDATEADAVPSHDASDEQISVVITPTAQLSTDKSPARPRRSCVQASQMQQQASSPTSVSGSKATTTTKKSRVAETWNTQVRYVPQHELVWAPNYQYNNGLFPGRIAKESETSSCKGITWPIPEHEMVVELFSIPKSNDNRFMVVIKEKVLPYYADRRKGADADAYDAEAKKEWNPRHMDEVKQHLGRKKLSKAEVERIFKNIKHTAEEFLRLALHRGNDGISRSPAPPPLEDEDSPASSTAVPEGGDGVPLLSQLTVSTIGSMEVHASQRSEERDTGDRSSTALTTDRQLKFPGKGEEAALVIRPGMLLIQKNHIGQLIKEPHEVIRFSEAKDIIYLSGNKQILNTNKFAQPMVAIVEQNEENGLHCLTRLHDVSDYQLLMEEDQEMERSQSDPSHSSASIAAVAVVAASNASDQKSRKRNVSQLDENRETDEVQRTQKTRKSSQRNEDSTSSIAGDASHSEGINAANSARRTRRPLRK